jgi:hypothetical protein
MQPQRPCNRIDEVRLWYCLWYYVTKFEFHEVNAANDWVVGTDVADFDEDKED